MEFCQREALRRTGDWWACGVCGKRKRRRLVGATPGSIGRRSGGVARNALDPRLLSFTPSAFWSALTCQRFVMGWFGGGLVGATSRALIKRRQVGTPCQFRMARGSVLAVVGATLSGSGFGLIVGSGVVRETRSTSIRTGSVKRMRTDVRAPQALTRVLMWSAR